MPKESNHIENLLTELRSNYLADLPSRFDLLDNSILKIKSTNDIQAEYENLYRNVHSIKGSAGTHALHILSTICHDFEDQLSMFDNKLSEVSKKDCDNWLKYTDLLRKAHNILQTHDSDLPAIEHELELLRKSGSNKISFRGLLVSPTKLQRQISETILENKAAISVANDGYEALGRLLATKYDFLITNHEISVLNGLALIAATRTGSIANRNIQAVLLTSNETLTLNRRTDPDFIILKNNKLTDNLSTVINEILESLTRTTQEAQHVR